MAGFDITTAEGVMKEKKSFSGGAGMYLKVLTEDFIPNVEQLLKLKKTAIFRGKITLKYPTCSTTSKEYNKALYSNEYTWNMTECGHLRSEMP